jgi:predicted permease
MSTLWHDVRYSFRMLLRNPGLTAVVILTLAFSIGVNIAVFTIVDGILLRPLPFPESNRLIFVGYHQNDMLDTLSGPDFLDWENQSQVFENLSALTFSDKNLTDVGRPMALKTWKVTTNYCQTMGIKPILGRGFLSEESIEGNHKVVILNHDLWQQKFGADPKIIGKRITLDGEPYTVIGVAPGKQGIIGQMAQILVPLVKQQLDGSRSSHAYLAFGRLKAGITLQQAQAEMDTIVSRLEQKYPNTNANSRVELMPLHKILIKEAGVMLWILFSAVGLFLLVAGVNVASILLARSETRRPEIAVRRALGASRFRVIRQILVESLVLSVLGGTAGLLMGYWAVTYLQQMLPNELFGGIPLFDQVQFHPRVFGFACIISLITGLLFGIIPAWHASRPILTEVLRQGTQTALGGSRRHGLLSVFVGTEIALALVLLVGAGLLAESFYRFQHVEPGFDGKQVLAVELELPWQDKYETHNRRLAFFRKVKRRIESISDVLSVDSISLRPLNVWKSSQGFRIEGRAPLPTGRHQSAEYRQVSWGYFSTMKMKLRSGRFLQEKDDNTNPVMVVNEAFVSRYLPDEEPLGKRILFRGRNLEIVGIVGNVKSRSMSLNLVEHPPKMYEPITQACDSSFTIMVRTKNDPTALIGPIQQKVWEVDGDLPIAKIHTMDDVLYESMALQYVGSLLMCVIALGALLLAVIGIYGLSAYSTNQRHHEYGIRLAIGAQSRDVHWLVMKKGLKLTAMGSAIGLVAALALARVLSSVLYDISVTDPVIFLGITLVLIITALLGCHIPARRAAKVDPMEALRYE